MGRFKKKIFICSFQSEYISSISVRGVKPRSLEGSRRSLNSKHSDKETEQAEKKTHKTLTTENLEPPTEDGQPLR